MKYKNIYTRRGDEGMTSIWSGQKLPKYHPLICLVGEIDELNAQFGVLKTLLVRDTHFIGKKEFTDATIRTMFSVMGMLNTSKRNTLYEGIEKYQRVVQSLIKRYARRLDKMTPQGQSDWIMYGSHGREEAQMQVVQCKIRRVERLLVEYLMEKQYKDALFSDYSIEHADVQAYIKSLNLTIKTFNALSKLLYICAAYYQKLNLENEIKGVYICVV